MQIKEFEAATLKECLRRVRAELGPDAVILETRKLKKGGVLGWGAQDAVCIVAATGITVNEASVPKRATRAPERDEADVKAAVKEVETRPSGAVKARQSEIVSEPAPRPKQAVASAAARAAFAKAQGKTATIEDRRPTPSKESARSSHSRFGDDRNPIGRSEDTRISDARANAARSSDAVARDIEPEPAPRRGVETRVSESDAARLRALEEYLAEIRTSLSALQREQRESQERTVTAVVSAVAPAMNAVTTLSALADVHEPAPRRLAALRDRLVSNGVDAELADEMIDALPDFDAWGEDAQIPLAESALRDLISRRIRSAGPIRLTPGSLKTVALIGPTGVGKTTTIAKLAAHFSLVEGYKVALLTVDTYRIAAVEQLKTYSQIIDIPISVAYSQDDVPAAIAKFAGFDLLLIDTAGRSQKNVMQVNELKSLLESIDCETHLVLSAQIKEQDMLEAAQRFSSTRVDGMIFSKLDETNTYGTLLNVADRCGIPLSYITTGQKVPEDIELADGVRLAQLLLSSDVQRERQLVRA